MGKKAQPFGIFVRDHKQKQKIKPAKRKEIIESNSQEMVKLREYFKINSFYKKEKIEKDCELKIAALEAKIRVRISPKQKGENQMSEVLKW
jgi:hypothetical protein